MDYLLLILAFICLVIGFVGSVVPAIPGPPLSWLGLLLLKLCDGNCVTWTWLAIFGAVVILTTVLDFVVPAWGAKKFGGTRAGAWGATFGWCAGLFLLPFGMWWILAGSFLGAFTFELIAKKSAKQSLKAAFGAFLGFLLGVGLKMIACAWMLIYAVSQLITFRAA